MSDDFDDISSLLNDVLNDVEPDITTPEIVDPTPEEVKETVESLADPNDIDDLGEYLQTMADTPEPETVITPEPAPDPVEEEVDSVEDMLAALTAEDEPEVTQVCKTDEGLTTEQINEGLALEKEDLPTDSDILSTPEIAEAMEATAAGIQEHVFADVVEKAAIPLPTFTTDDIAESLDIRNFATLVTLNTARWHAKVKDRTAAKAAADAAGATPDAFEARKKLLAGCDAELKAVHKEIDNARTEHYRLTMPWSAVGVNDIGKRSGGRLMPNTLFLDYTAAMAQCKANMEAKLAIFVAKYPSLLAVVQQKLGTAYDPSQYPNPSSIAAHFNLSFDFNPVPMGEDFKGLQQAQTEKLSAALNRKTRTMLENALQDAWQTLYNNVSHAATVLATPGKMFHKTLIEKLVSQASLLTHLNATMDPRFAQVANMISNELVKHDPKDIRKDDALRKRLADEAKLIVKYMEEAVSVTVTTGEP